MRSLTKIILAAAFAALIPATALAVDTSTLTVHVENPSGNPLQGVKVAVIQWGMNGPSTYTQVGLTDALGDKVFTDIQVQMGYSIYVTSHGYSPTVNDQFNDPDYNPNRHFWASDAVNPLTAEFTLTPGLTGVGIVRQEFSNATVNTVLMGGMYNMLAQMPGPQGIVETDGAGNGVLEIENVPFAEANTYNIGLYDPTQNRGIGRNVMSDLGDGSAAYPGNTSINYTGAATLSFLQSIPPSRVDREMAPGDTGSTSGASVEGVVHEVNFTSATVPHTGLGVKACVNGMNWNGWAHTDENGRFQLYGLTPGVTYYFNAMGGCTWSQSGPGACYEPYSSAEYNSQDICLEAGALNANDLLYVSSDVAYHSIALNRMPPSNGEIKVCVKTDTGMIIPNASVNLNPDGSPWPRDAQSCHATWQDGGGFNVLYSTNFINTPGYSNAMDRTGADGCVTLTGLPSGNYNVNVWTPFSNNSGGNSGFNAGADGTFTAFGMMSGPQMDWMRAHCDGTGGDDYRVTVATNVPADAARIMMVYDSSGAVVTAPIVGTSSITYVVAPDGDNTGVVHGTISFPSVVDLSASPIVITLYGNCMNSGPEGDPCPTGNLTVVDGGGTPASSYNYSLNVSSAYSYYINVQGRGWGRVRRGGGNDSIDLTISSFSVVNMEFAPAGTVTGKLYKPDGSIFTPATNQWIGINMGSESGWTYTQLSKDGSFTLTDVLPGINRVSVNASGMDGSSFNYAVPDPQPTVTVVAGTTTTLNINLVNATPVGVTLDTTKVPDPSVIMSEYDAMLAFKVMPVPAGTVIKGQTIAQMFFGKGGSEDSEFRYSLPTSTMTEGPCGRSWIGGFCAARLPSPAVYDMYLMRSGDFGNMEEMTAEEAALMPYPHFVMLSSTKNVIVDSAHANAAVNIRNSMSQSSGVLVNLTPSPSLANQGNATLEGTVTADNFFRQADYDSLGGDFDAFIEYLPVVSLYNSEGVFKAAGIVLPPPAWIAEKEQTKQFQTQFAAGYTQFKNMLDGAGSFGFQIRGLKPYDCYTAVFTSPNYPSYQTRTCVGANRSTTTLTINLDTAVGAGATVTGVVRTTNSVIMPNVTVSISGEGLESKSVVTDSSGSYKFEGLPAGTVKVRVSAEGYALAEADSEVTGDNTYTQHFTLTAGAGSITGTVYSQKMPYAKVQAGAQIIAYDDTYNGLNRTLPLPLIKTKTGTDGTYRLTGLIPDHYYKVFLKVPGKYTLNVTTPATTGVVAGVDFTMLPKPLDLEIFAKKGADFYEFTVLNPKDFKNGEARWSASPYNAAGSTVLNLQELASGEMVGKIPLGSLTAGITYTLRASATSYSLKNVTKEMFFGLNYKGNAQQHIDDLILGDDSEDDKGRRNNEAPLDKSGDDQSAIMFPPGAMLPVSTGAVPTCTFKGEDKTDASVADKVAALGADAFAGNLYTVALASVTQNEGKGFDLTLAYDKSTADLTDITVARYNDSTAKWEQATGIATVNPLKGTVKVRLRSLASVLDKKQSGTAPQFNQFDGKKYVVSGAGPSAATTGTFAVIRPSVAGAGFAGDRLKVFNYPNPFNLKSKAINNNHGATLNPGTTYGTVIRMDVPAANGGPCHIRIYTLAGELVNTMSDVCAGGQYNYIVWDGRTKNGQEVANGVYYGVVELSGRKQNRKDTTFKMAVIK